MLLTHYYQHHKLEQRKPLMLLTYYQHHKLVQRKLLMLLSTTNWSREIY